jgi:hypothetical protein
MGSIVNLLPRNSDSAASPLQKKRPRIFKPFGHLSHMFLDQRRGERERLPLNPSDFKVLKPEGWNRSQGYPWLGWGG